MASSSELSPDAALEQIKKFHQELSNKRTFCPACEKLVKVCENVENLDDKSKDALFEAEKATQWRDAAMQEVDEDARDKAEALKEKLRLEWEKKFNQGRFCDARRGFTQAELAMTQGYVLVDADDARPGMSRDAQAELRLVTVTREEDCPICREPMKLGSKAKAMPCGHLYHDDCLLSWVSKNNSCPMCRFDELPSEKHHFDDVERRIRKEDPGRKGIFT